MKRYDKVIFICTGNTFLSPVAEGIYRAKAPVWMPEPYSRGLVVLFEEPISPKVNLLLSQHELPPSDHIQSRQMEREDISEVTLILTMTLSEKVQFLEEFGDTGKVYTLGEYTGVETDVSDPYGAEDEAYENCFEDLSQRVELVIARLEREYHDSNETEEHLQNTREDLEQEDNK